MVEWHVVYHETPFMHTTPRAIIVEAETRAKAIAVAADHILRSGHSIDLGADTLSAKLGLGFAEVDAVRAYVPASRENHGRIGSSKGAVHITHLARHEVEVRGKVRGRRLDAVTPRHYRNSTDLERRRGRWRRAGATAVPARSS